MTDYLVFKGEGYEANIYDVMLEGTVDSPERLESLDSRFLALKEMAARLAEAGVESIAWAEEGSTEFNEDLIFSLSSALEMIKFLVSHSRNAWTPSQLKLQIANLPDFVPYDHSIYPKTPSEILAVLDDCWIDGELAENIARHPNAPKETLFGFIDSEYYEIFDKILENPAITTEVLEKLWEKGTLKNCATILDQPLCPRFLKNTKIGRFIQSRRENWDESLWAGQSNTPTKILDFLTRNASSGILTTIAGNPRTSPETLQQIADNDDEEIREVVAYNQMFHQKPLEYLLKIGTSMSEKGSQTIRKHQ